MMPALSPEEEAHSRAATALIRERVRAAGGWIPFEQFMELALYAPGLGSMEDPIWEAMRRADCVLVDGTFWTDDEMIRLGLSRKRAREIGHLPQSGTGGMLEWLGQLPGATRKILIHINNTNPILDETSPERAELRRRGVEVAWDGMEIVL